MPLGSVHERLLWRLRSAADASEAACEPSLERREVGWSVDMASMTSAIEGRKGGDERGKNGRETRRRGRTRPGGESRARRSERTWIRVRKGQERAARAPKERTRYVKNEERDERVNMCRREEGKRIAGG